ncbi:MAG: cache domain-containing protein [Bacteroidales bacterium]|nr:cache domain-containing protein [Bacteroidales bacterium]
MSADKTYKFYLRIVLPSILAISLFVISFFVIIIPAFEKNMMERKKEMINELTCAAWSVMEEQDELYKADSISLEEAQEQAANVIGTMRYGDQGKDYFWIINMEPSMIMHPYRPELNGTDLSSYADPEGTLLFREAVKRVRERGEGYIQYIWQWKDDSTRLVPKLSYVKGYPEWNWIVGTGIYLEDVKHEITNLRKHLIRISLLIILIIAIALFYIVRQSLRLEVKRKLAEKDLKLSQLKYKSLVEASTEGTIMMLRRKIIFANVKFARMVGKSTTEVQQLAFEALFDISWGEVMRKFTDPDRSVSLETNLLGGDDQIREVVISVSRVDYVGDEGYIVVCKDISRQKRLEIGTANLTQELQMALLLMNQSVRHFVREHVTCSADTKVSEAAALLKRKDQEVVFVENNGLIIGVVTKGDFLARVLATGMDPLSPVAGVMSSPVICIQEDALVYEAILLFKNHTVSHLLVKNLQGEDIGAIAYLEVLKMQQNTLNLVLKEIAMAGSIGELEKINDRTPVLVNALLESGDKTGNINHIITSISDALSQRMFELLLEKFGPSPCNFAFIALGSEGRKEQTLSTDQDNAIVFEDVDKATLEKAYGYFGQLARELNTGLSRVGFRLCKGEIMAMNPRWTQPLSVWKEYFTGWITNSDPQSILDSSIFFDLRCIYGDCTLVTRLISHIHEQTDHQAVFFQHQANPIIKSRSRVNLFGGIISDQETSESKMIDIKKIQRPIIGLARIYALKHKLEETNTLKRLEKLYQMQVLGRELYEELTQAYSVLMKLRLRFQARAELNNLPPDNMVDISELSAIELTTLKKVLSELGNIQTKLSFDFKGSV